VKLDGLISVCTNENYNNVHVCNQVAHTRYISYSERYAISRSFIVSVFRVCFKILCLYGLKNEEILKLNITHQIMKKHIKLYCL